MKCFSFLLVVAFVGVCLAAEPAPTPQAKEPTYQGKTLGEWMIIAKNEDTAARADAALAIGNMGPTAEAAIPVLTDLLKDRFAGISQLAMEALIKIGRPAIPALKGMLKDENKSARHYAADCLLGISPNGPEATAAFETTMELLTDKDAVVRCWAADDLRGPQAKAAIPALMECFKDKNGLVRCAAASALWRISSNEPEKKKGIAALVELATDKDAEVRHDAARVLGRIGPEVIPILTELLSSKDWKIRYAVAEAFQNLVPQENDSTAVPVLLGLFKDENALVRCAAASALWKIRRGSPEAKSAIPVLVELFSDKDAEVRQAAVLALGEIGSEAKQAVPAVTKLLKDKDQWVRCYTYRP